MLVKYNKKKPNRCRVFFIESTIPWKRLFP